MTYDFRHLSTLNHYNPTERGCCDGGQTPDACCGGRSARSLRGLGDDDGGAMAAIESVVSAFLPKINELQAAGDAAAQAQVDAIIANATGGAKSSAPVTTTASGSSSPSSAGGNDYVVVNGVCKARNFPALTAAKDLQMQLNRVAKVRGYRTIGVDGEIGPASVNLMAQVGPEMGAIGFSSCSVVTSQIGTLTAGVKSLADSLSAPPASATDVARAAGAGTISVVATNGKILAFKPPGASASIADTVKNLPTTTKLLGLGVIVVGGALAYKKYGRRGGSSAPSSSTALVPVSNPRRRRRRR